MKQEITIIPNQIELEKQFEYVNSIIEQHRSSAITKVNTEVLLTNWEIGQYISMQLKSSVWGAKVVSDLADYLKRQNPKRRGYAKRNLYNMVKFYEMYSREDFVTLTDTLNINEFVQLPTAQLGVDEFVQLPTAQVASATFKQKIPSLLAITTWRIQPANAIKS